MAVRALVSMFLVARSSVHARFLLRIFHVLAHMGLHAAPILHLYIVLHLYLVELCHFLLKNTRVSVELFIPERGP